MRAMARLHRTTRPAWLKPRSATPALRPDRLRGPARALRRAGPCPLRYRPETSGRCILRRWRLGRARRRCRRDEHRALRRSRSIRSALRRRDHQRCSGTATARRGRTSSSAVTNGAAVIWCVARASSTAFVAGLSARVRLPDDAVLADTHTATRLHRPSPAHHACGRRLDRRRHIAAQGAEASLALGPPTRQGRRR